jgi:hypothetical protein
MARHKKTNKRRLGNFGQQQQPSSAERGKQISRGWAIRESRLRLGRINLAAVRRSWVLLRCVFSFARLHWAAKKKKKAAALLRAIENQDGKLPSLYKAKQWGQSGHETYVDKHKRKLAQSVIDRDQALAVAKEARADLVRAERDKEKAERNCLKLQVEIVQQQAVVKDAKKAGCAKKKVVIRRENYLRRKVLPALVQSVAHAKHMSPEQTLQLVRDHIRQVLLVSCVASV